MELQGDLTRELPYWTIRDGAVVLRDGSYRLGFEVTLPGTEVWDATQLAACNERLRLLVGAAVPEGECLRILLEIHSDYTDLLRAYAAECRSPHPIVQDLHRRRASSLSSAHASGQLVNSRLIFDLSYHPGPRPRRPWWRPIDAATYQRHLAELRILRDMLVGTASDADSGRARSTTERSWPRSGDTSIQIASGTARRRPSPRRTRRWRSREGC